MIFDALANDRRYFNFHPGFKAAFQYLHNPLHHALPSGRHPIDGDRLYAMVIRAPGKGRDKVVSEIHRKYIDIQYSIQGTDTMGWRNAGDCQQIEKPFDEAKDCGLFADPLPVWFDLPPGHFAIFYPWDAHAPMCGVGDLHKIVIKVAMEG
jgi:biofilm protein TabA